MLNAKYELGKKGSGFERVYVRSSQSHEERLIRLNTQTLISAMPNGEQYRMTMTGRLVKKDEAWDEKQRQRRAAAGNTPWFTAATGGATAAAKGPTAPPRQGSNGGQAAK